MLCFCAAQVDAEVALKEMRDRITLEMDNVQEAILHQSVARQDADEVARAAVPAPILEVWRILSDERDIMQDSQRENRSVSLPSPDAPVHKDQYVASTALLLHCPAMSKSHWGSSSFMFLANGCRGLALDGTSAFFFAGWRLLLRETGIAAANLLGKFEAA